MLGPLEGGKRGTQSTTFIGGGLGKGRNLLAEKGSGKPHAPGVQKKERRRRRPLREKNIVSSKEKKKIPRILKI